MPDPCVPLPKTEIFNQTFTLSTSLKVALDRYAALHSQTYGEAVDAVALIPHMLKASMEQVRIAQSPIHRCTDGHLRSSSPQYAHVSFQ